jgi:hypothetical protein
MKGGGRIIFHFRLQEVECLTCRKFLRLKSLKEEEA